MNDVCRQPGRAAIFPEMNVLPLLGKHARSTCRLPSKALAPTIGSRTIGGRQARATEAIEGMAAMLMSGSLRMGALDSRKHAEASGSVNAIDRATLPAAENVRAAVCV
jgi:hypothetical protein